MMLPCIFVYKSLSAIVFAAPADISFTRISLGVDFKKCSAKIIVIKMQKENIPSDIGTNKESSLFGNIPGFFRGALIAIMVGSALALIVELAPEGFGVVKDRSKSGADIISGISGFIEKIERKILPESWFTGESAPLELSPGFENESFLGVAAPYEAKLDYEEAVIGTVESASPAVVSIIVSKDVPILERCPVTPFMGDDSFRFYVPCPSPSGKTERKEIGGGTGFIVASDGLIVTNKHVVSDSKAAYTVFLQDGDKYESSVVAMDDGQDIAILKIEASGLPTLRLGDSDSVRLAQTAIAIGNALGEYKNTVSVGVISGKDRTVTASGPSGTETIEGVFQTDAAINPGNSGGPLLNLKGEVIGINTAIASGAENIGFAIPSNKARRALETYGRTGRIETPYLGVWYEKTEEGAKIGGNGSGPSVAVDSPAAKAGIKEGDIIIEAGGRSLNGDISLSSVIAEKYPGEALSLKIKRGGEVIDISVVLGVKN